MTVLQLRDWIKQCGDLAARFASLFERSLISGALFNEALRRLLAEFGILVHNGLMHLNKSSEIIERHKNR